MDMGRDRPLPATEVVWRKARDPAESRGRFEPVSPSVTVVNGVQCERDIGVALRDGTVSYVDVYRCAGDAAVPVIISWGPNGKRAGYLGHGGPAREVPPGTCSPSTMGEGPDPDFWCHHGYAVINVDPPGVGNSQGDCYYSGRAEGLDCADLIEWAGRQAWSNGKVGMAGSSYYAMVQLFAAAEQPEYLAAIAPWEARTDLYRQMLCQGGIPEVSFMAGVRDRIFGYGLTQDLVETLHENPLMNEIWAEKIVDLARITVPTYLTASWSHFNLLGSIQAFREIGSSAKWIRIYRDFEWADAYQPANLEELRRFFDRYLKGLHNGWELTPTVRLDVMDAGEWDAISRRPEREFPLARAIHERLFLDAAHHRLSATPADTESALAYQAGRESVAFDAVLPEQVEVTGYLKLRLWIECVDADDADIFVWVQKLGTDGRERPTLVLGRPHPGAWGRLRASHRGLDAERSTESEPYLEHATEQRLSAGEVVPLDIAIWPTSRIWHPGETLRVLIAGHYIRDDEWFEDFVFDTRSTGTQIIHTGGRYDSHLLIPLVARYPAVTTDMRNARSVRPLPSAPTAPGVVHRALARPSRHEA